MSSASYLSLLCVRTNWWHSWTFITRHISLIGPFEKSKRLPGSDWVLSFCSGSCRRSTWGRCRRRRRRSRPARRGGEARGCRGSNSPRCAVESRPRVSSTLTKKFCQTLRHYIRSCCWENIWWFHRSDQVVDMEYNEQRWNSFDLNTFQHHLDLYKTI